MSTDALVRQRDQYQRSAAAHNSNAQSYQNLANDAVNQLADAQRQLALARGAKNACESLCRRLSSYHASVHDYARNLKTALQAGSVSLSGNEQKETNELAAAVSAADSLVVQWEAQCRSFAALRDVYAQRARSERDAAYRSQQAANQCQRSINNSQH